MRRILYVAATAAIALCSLTAHARPLVFTAPDGQAYDCALKLNGKPARLDCFDEEQPIPTPDPTHSPSPTATPAPTAAFRCSTDPSSWFNRISPTLYSRLNVTLEVGVPRAFCLDLPAKAFPFFELYTVNLGNASCSDLEMVVTQPNGREWTDRGPAPLVRPNVEAGIWLVEVLLHEGCNRYDFRVAY